MTLIEGRIDKQDIIEKFDSLASNFSEMEYSNLDVYMLRRAKLAMNWGKRLVPGDSIVELGCGNGQLLILLAKQEFKCIGVDISPKMIETSS
jgi:ubiquinone/menaquinone biosynthesis C-methylase UbiE